MAQVLGTLTTSAKPTAPICGTSSELQQYSLAIILNKITKRWKRWRHLSFLL